MKHRCVCGKIATWQYAPSDRDAYCCDDCVPRGCSCNIIDHATGEEERDEKDRLLPCCEWWEDRFGIDDMEPDWSEYSSRYEGPFLPQTVDEEREGTSCDGDNG